MMSSIASNFYPAKEMAECFARHRPNDGENENCAMFPDEFTSRMKEILEGDGYDEEQLHIEMDRLMCDLLISLGYSDGVNLFIKAPKFYS